MTIPTVTDNLLGEIEAAAEAILDRNEYDRMAVKPANVLALITRIRELEKDAARYQGMRAVVMAEREGCTAKLYDDECDRLLSKYAAMQGDL